MQDKARQGKTRHDKTREGKTTTRQGNRKTRQDKTRQDKTRQDKTKQDKTRQRVHCADVVTVTENEGLFEIKTTGNDVSTVISIGFRVRVIGLGLG